MLGGMDEERAGSFKKLPVSTIRESLTYHTTRRSIVTSSFMNFDIVQDQPLLSSVGTRRNLKDLRSTSAMYQSSGKQQFFVTPLS